MPVSELIRAAHENAKEKGFWRLLDAAEDANSFDVSHAAVVQKLALISTEVYEFESEAFERRPNEALEELADVVIRAFDLAGYLGYSGGGMSLGGDLLRALPDPEPSNLAYGLYRETAEAIRHYQNVNEVILLACLDEIVNQCAQYAAFEYGLWALHRAVVAKMEKNRARSPMHGKRC